MYILLCPVEDSLLDVDLMLGGFVVFFPWNIHWYDKWSYRNEKLDITRQIYLGNYSVSTAAAAAAAAAFYYISLTLSGPPCPLLLCSARLLRILGLLDLPSMHEYTLQCVHRAYPAGSSMTLSFYPRFLGFTFLGFGEWSPSLQRFFFFSLSSLSSRCPF